MMKSPSAYKLFIIFLSVLISLPILAPILSAGGLHDLAKPIYFMYSFLCHQFDTRSIHILDHQYAWCARDMGIWFSAWLTSLLISNKVIKQIPLWVLPVFIIPIALDGGVQTLSTISEVSSSGMLDGEIFYISNNLTRFITGGIFGIGIGALMTKLLLQSGKLEGTINLPHLLDNALSKIYNVSILLFIILFTYISMVGIWSFSSRINKPTNFLDSEPKVNSENFFARRLHGECPTLNPEEVFEIECFF